MAINTDWANPANYTDLITNGLNVYFQFIPRDLFVAFILTVIAIGIFIGSEGNLKLTFGFLMLTQLFFALILDSGVMYAYMFVVALIGAGLLYKSYFGGTR